MRPNFKKTWNNWKNHPYFRCDYSKYPSSEIENAVCIPLTSGKHCIIDAEDFDKIKEFRWALSSNYAYSKKIKQMHRVIMNTPSGLFTDHINRDFLDNRKTNLRFCTKQQNQFNKACNKGTSKYRGVSLTKHKKWTVKIRKDGRPTYLGTFNSEIDAAKCYDIAAKKYFGEFAYLNFGTNND